MECMYMIPYLLYMMEWRLQSEFEFKNPICAQQLAQAYSFVAARDTPPPHRWHIRCLGRKQAMDCLTVSLYSLNGRQIACR